MMKFAEEHRFSSGVYPTQGDGFAELIISLYEHTRYAHYDNEEPRGDQD